ncbi:hypothetical protein ACROYT_G009168 [Oculina patagonica]
MKSNVFNTRPPRLSCVCYIRFFEAFSETLYVYCLQQLIIGNVLDIPYNRITVRTKRLGGAFGGKDSGSFPVSCATAIAAYKTGRPVRSVLDRKEDMISTGKRHPFLARCKIGCTANGKIKALDAELFVNGGNSMDVSDKIVDNALYHLDNAYFIPNFRGVGRVCKTNTISNTAMRGFGAPQAILIIETLISTIAKTCGLNQTQVRECNFYQEQELTHLNQKLENCTIKLVWEKLLDKSDFQARELQVNEFNRINRWRKRGIALNPLKYGIGFAVKRLNYGAALVHVYTDGSVLVSHGGVEMGQGLHTKMMQVTSQELGIPMSKIHIKETSTESVPNTAPTGASVATDINGMAVADACKKIINRLDPYRQKTPQASWEELVKIALADRVSLSATGYYRMPEAGIDLKNNRRTFPYFTFGAACSEVEIDCLTGDHEVLRTDIVMDLGRSLNPGIDIGQIEGAFVQGMGLFTTEQLEFTSQGNLLPTGPNSYMIPTMSDIPTEFYVHLLPGVQNPKGLYSSKAVGEPPLICAVSVYQAIKNAISAAREEVGLSGSFRLDSPATSERIRMSCSPYLADMKTSHSGENGVNDVF